MTTTAITARALAMVGAVLAAALPVILARFQQAVINGFIAIASLTTKNTFKFVFLLSLII